MHRQVCTSLLDEFAADLAASVLPLPPTIMRMLRVLRTEHQNTVRQPVQLT